ncbi:uncharacterized protein LOC120648195 [Panicum virgatum]|uniref:uncharacterized protein LOC120648195 n=1 Tax=Panicum virgatum TaxID=38727 RepID=UPI0019D5E1DB|nr:uncharacterized protein LOC120648195 [Panicum virgatum]
MAASSSCAICGLEDSWKHSLLECNMAKCVWALEKDEITDLIGELQEQGARAWLAHVFSELASDDLVRVVVTMWAIWYARRKAIHEAAFQSPLSTPREDKLNHYIAREDMQGERQSTHSLINHYIADLELTKSTPREDKQVQYQGARWIPPPLDFVKINVDAATSKNSNQASVAAVARDSSGSFLGASTLVFSGVFDPETLEVLACREGLALASDLLFQKVRVASDCLNAIRSLQEDGMGRYGHITREIKESMTSFLKIDFVHERREFNQEAHKLARSAIYDSVGRHVWFCNPPEGVCIQTISVHQ